MNIEIMPSLECNLKCVGCDRGLGTGPLKVEPLKDPLLVASLIEKCGQVSSITISGGEPTLYPKINELIRILPEGIPIEVKTNGAWLLKLNVEILIRCHWSVTVYKESQKFLDFRFMNKLVKLGIISMSPSTSFDDLDNVGTEKTGFDPMRCFMPTIIGNEPKVYPCCRAFRFTHSTGNNYFLPIEEFSVIELSKIITDTDMCSHCPRFVVSERISK